MTRPLLVRLPALALVAILLAAPTALSGHEAGHLSPLLDEARLVPEGVRYDDEFGRAVALDGDRLVVGASFDDTAGSNSGAVYVYERSADGWVLDAKLVPPGSRPGDYFGESVALHGDVLVAGARLDDDVAWDGGAAHVWRHGESGWAYEATLTGPDSTHYDHFGADVALHGGLIVVGAVHDDDAVLGTNSGSAYVFESDGAGGWDFVQKLTASDGAAYDGFGFAVAAAPDLVVVGTYLHDHGVANSGAVYVYERNATGWTQVQELRDATPSGSEHFGEDVATDGATIAVGVPGDDAVRYDGGAVVLYRHDGSSWTQTARLSDPEPVHYARVGTVVAVDGGRVAAGAPRTDVPAYDAGHVVVWEEAAGWNGTRIVRSDAQNWEYFGSSVAVDGETLVAGAPQADAPWMDTGLVLVFGFDDDGDGLANAAERFAGLDPQNPDTDGDGLTDGDEVLVHETDPLARDTDGDLYGDGTEIAYGSDPLDVTSNPPTIGRLDAGAPDELPDLPTTQ